MNETDKEFLIIFTIAVMLAVVVFAYLFVSIPYEERVMECRSFGTPMTLASVGYSMTRCINETHICEKNNIDNELDCQLKEAGK